MLIWYKSVQNMSNWEKIWLTCQTWVLFAVKYKDEYQIFFETWLSLEIFTQVWFTDVHNLDDYYNYQAGHRGPVV